MKYLLLEEVGSTNSYAALHAAQLDDMTMILANSQSAGRGQRGNSWESEPGKNLTFTLIHRPQDFPARRQFLLSEATALAVVDFLRSEGVEAMVKWPNDIYVDNRKICGILIEHSLIGARIEHSRLGVGININQERFLSDAPNPVSLVQLTGRPLDLSSATARIGNALAVRLAQAAKEIQAEAAESEKAQTATPDASSHQSLHEEFLSRLWRHDSLPHPFRIRETGREFQGTIQTVRPDGFIEIQDPASPSPLSFAFKEVEFLL